MVFYSSNTNKLSSLNQESKKWVSGRQSTVTTTMPKPKSFSRTVFILLGCQYWLTCKCLNTQWPTLRTRKSVPNISNSYNINYDAPSDTHFFYLQRHLNISNSLQDSGPWHMCIPRDYSNPSHHTSQPMMNRVWMGSLRTRGKVRVSPDSKKYQTREPTMFEK